MNITNPPLSSTKILKSPLWLQWFLWCTKQWIIFWNKQTYQVLSYYHYFPRGSETCKPGTAPRLFSPPCSTNRHQLTETLHFDRMQQSPELSLIIFAASSYAWPRTLCHLPARVLHSQKIGNDDSSSMLHFLNHHPEHLLQHQCG